MTERLRVESLNRGRSEVLEMLAQDKSTAVILKTLTDVLARHRSTWSCALHLWEDGALKLAASSRLPDKLIHSIERLDLFQQDAPEITAHSAREVVCVEDILAARRPWTELLVANNVKSVLSAPFLSADGKSLGTLTVYMLLRYNSQGSDRELLQSHCQMATMVLERSRLQTDLRRQAYHDSLTGLPNRLLARERLIQAVAHAKRRGECLAVLGIDLNKFKQINDVHGHAAGDWVLQTVAERITRRLREVDTVARMGGDEFMVILEQLQDRETACAVANDLLASLCESIVFDQRRLDISASIGIALYPQDGQTIEELERNADAAMYQAKFGQLGIRTFTPALDRAASERRELQIEMRKALEEGGFRLHYQPQYDKQGQVRGFEALLRFTHPTLGPISPSKVISIAEESDFIVELGSWVLREACRQNHEWQARGLPSVPVAVNISAMQLAKRDFTGLVSRTLTQTGLPARYLELEMTESVLIKDFSESIRQLKELKALGISIAIDDFGTGYSSLNYLHQLPIDHLKIDRSFVQAICEPNGTLAIVEAIFAMAQSKGLMVIAEGIENEEQKSILMGKRCDLMQGYLFSPPISSDQACELLIGEHRALNTSSASLDSAQLFLSIMH